MLIIPTLPAEWKKPIFKITDSYWYLELGDNFFWISLVIGANSKGQAVQSCVSMETLHSYEPHVIAPPQMVHDSQYYIDAANNHDLMTIFQGMRDEYLACFGDKT